MPADRDPRRSVEIESEPVGTSAADGTAELVLDDVTRRFGGVEAVSHVSFAVHAGEVLGLIGPNGAGKSTLLSLISGAQRPSGGRITFRGQRLDRLPAYAVARLGVGRAHQIPRPFGRMTALDNVRVAAHSTSTPRRVLEGTPFDPRGSPGNPERDTQVRDVLELCGLADRAHRLAGTLPLLDLKRLEIARALALEPHLLLLDEVAAGLVGREVDEVIGLVRRISARGTTLIVVEHVQTLIQALAQRVIVLDWGRLIAEGTPAQVARDPNVVAVYLGSQAEPVSTSPRPTDVSASAVLRAEGISVEYGRLTALRSLDMAVRPGEVVAVLGANGAGKTTLARALTGLVPLSAGRILLDGIDISRQPAHLRARQGIGLCHEGRRLFGELTVADNLELGAVHGSAARAPAGRPLAERLERVYTLFPEIKDKQHLRAGLLSGGQQQMVAIARALVAEPRIIIFDELSLGLAPQVIDRIYPALEQVRDWGIGVVLIEQNVHRALARADRVYLMERGQVTYAGTPSDLDQRGLLHTAYFGQARTT